MDPLTKDIAKIFILIGIVLLTIGVILYYSNGKIKLFNLPGDIVIKREDFSFYFPITSLLIISILISVVFKIIKKI